MFQVFFQRQHIIDTCNIKSRRKAPQLTPPTFSKWDPSFLKSARAPLKYQVNIMSNKGSCCTWQGKMTLSPTETSILEGAKVILVGSIRETICKENVSIFYHDENNLYRQMVQLTYSVYVWIWTGTHIHLCNWKSSSLKYRVILYFTGSKNWC